MLNDNIFRTVVAWNNIALADEVLNLTTDQKIRVGVIGVGYLGKFHAEKYAAMEEADLVGVVDLDRKVAEGIATRLGASCYADYHDLLADVDAVSIVVPTIGHHKVALDCLNNGKDVLIEKPITSTLDEADELIRLAEKKGRIIQVGHLERFNPALVAIEGYLTKPMFIESHRIHMFKNRGVDVDVVLDLMIHEIDIILNIVDSPIKTIHAVGLPVVTPTTDIANARLIFENGCTANVTVSRISKDNIRRLRIFQPRSFISVDYGKKEFIKISLKDTLNSEGLPEEDIIRKSLVEQDALEAELRDFVKNVREHSKPRVSGFEGRRALAVAHEIIEQMQTHRKNNRHFFENA